MNEYQVNDNGDLRKYFIQVPNLIDDIELSVFAFRLYVHLKRVAGDAGKCWQSTRTLADECGMSPASVSRSKDELEAKKLITIEEKPNEHGGKPYHEISIVDIWDKNFASFSQKHQVPHRNLQVSPEKLASSPQKLKNNSIKKNTEEEDNTTIRNTQTALRTYTLITSQMAPPYNEKDRVLHNMSLILDYYGWDVDVAVAEGKKVYAEWCSTRSNQTGKHYRKTNSNWTEWWTENLAPETKYVSPEKKPQFTEEEREKIREMQARGMSTREMMDALAKEKSV